MMIHLSKVKLAFVTVLVSVGFNSYLLPGLTQFSSQVNVSLQPPPSPSPSPQPNTSQQGQRTPGGTRSDCKKTDKPLTALVPEDVKGETTAEYPVFWFYIPDAPENINTIKFSLHDRDDRDDQKAFYQTSVKLTKTPGVIGIPLPSKPEHSLKLNQTYHWNLIVYCDQQLSVDNSLQVYGVVTRVQQSHNAWYDQLTNLGKRYLAEPQNSQVKKAWTEMLKSVGLEELAQESLVSSVN